MGKNDSGGSGNSGGVGFVGLLTLLFIGLKLGGVIHWSWIWVLSPMWLTVVGVLVCFGAMLGTAFYLESKK